jgi:CRISPR/Cas system-associated exonuclease Cas4 (RecB family)
MGHGSGASRKMYKGKKLELSPTTGLNLFLECPRCFWLRYREKVHRPAIPFPSLPSGMDRILKEYYDSFRIKSGMPPEIEGKVEGKLFPDQERMESWRNWRKGLRFEDPKLDAVLRGALDECLFDGKYHIPLDIKTRGAAPKEGQSEEYYQTQLDCYAFLLDKNGYKTRDFAYLVYYFPESVSKKHQVNFNTEVVKLETDPERAYKIFSEAVNCYRGPIPPSHTECGFCAWYSDLLEYD